MEPVFIEKPAFDVIGMRYFGRNEQNEIPLMWDRFVKRMSEIRHRVDEKIAYGVCQAPEPPEADGSFEYIACVGVDRLDEIPPGMVGRSIPGQYYAVFTHKGPVSRIRDTYGYIMGTWKPRSGYELSSGPELEVYGERFNPEDQDHSEIDIYIPVRR